METSRNEVMLSIDPKNANKGELKSLFAEFTSLRPEQRQEVFGFYFDKDFAAHYNVTPKTLCAWKKDPRFEREKRKLYLQRVDKRLPNVIDRMLDKAEDGDVVAGKEILKMAGLLEDTIRIKTETQINILMVGIIESLNKHINDEHIINAIADDLERLSNDLE
jgi:hypothetical protein